MAFKIREPVRSKIAIDSNILDELSSFNTSNVELNPIYHLLALLGAHHIFHISGLRVNYLGNWNFLKRSGQ